MGIFDWFKHSGVFSARETKSSAVGPVISNGITGLEPSWSKRDYENFAKESYVRNAIGFRCQSLVSQSVAGIPLLLNDASGKEIEKHPVLDLLARPNPLMTYSFMMDSIITYLQISGNSYLESVGPSRLNAPPRELWVLRPDRMNIVAGKTGIPQAFKYRANGAEKIFQVDQITGASEILHMRKFNPTDDWYGLAPTESAAFSLDRHNAAGAHNMAVLQNSATPSGALVFKPVKGKNGSEVSPPTDVIESAEKRLLARHTGAGNAARPMVLNGNVDWQSFGMSMEELQLTESKLDAARDICIVYGVPIELLLPGQSTFNNRREAKLAFYEETVLTTLGMVLQYFNMWLLPRFDEGLVLKPNLDEISALELRREIRQESTIKLYGSGLITLDEARDSLQYEPEPNMPQRAVDASVLTALINGTVSNEMMSVPLLKYLQSRGLVDSNVTEDDFIGGAVDDDDGGEVVSEDGGA